jgi:hypothetical protein
MMLGDLLVQFSDKTSAAEALLALGDLKLLAAVRRRAAAEGVEPGTIVVRAVTHYAERAPDEEWVTLLGALGSSADPGRAFIRRALRMEAAF